MTSFYKLENGQDGNIFFIGKLQDGSTLVQDNQEKNINVVTIRGNIRSRVEKVLRVWF